MNINFLRCDNDIVMICKKILIFRRCIFECGYLGVKCHDIYNFLSKYTHTCVYKNKANMSK